MTQVKTDTNGAFVMGTVPPGPYALEFRAKSAAEVKNESFVIKIAGTKSRVSEQALSGRYFEGGASFVVETLPDIPLRGVIVRGSIINAKKMIWLPKEIGSSFPGRWVEEGSAQTVAGRN